MSNTSSSQKLFPVAGPRKVWQGPGQVFLGAGHWSVQVLSGPWSWG